jgi:hypothetical protein
MAKRVSYQDLKSVAVRTNTIKIKEVMGQGSYYDEKLGAWVNPAPRPKNGGSQGGKRSFNPQNYKRVTGCVEGTYKNADGEARKMIRAWRPDPYTRQGWQSAIAVPLNDAEPANGNTTHEKWVVTITDSMGKRKFNGLYNISKGLVNIPDLNLVMSPRGRGSFGHPKKRR